MRIDFIKQNGLVPAIIQDNTSMQVLMLGYMNEEALAKTEKEKRVTFFSRSKNRLWTKGETSGNFFSVVDIMEDCDNDTILIRVNPKGPSCHSGAKACFNNDTSKGFLYELERTISQRIDDNDEKSYTNQLFRKGVNKVAQKVGEEAVEVVIEAMTPSNSPSRGEPGLQNAQDSLLEAGGIAFKNEAADLLYHFLILLKAKNVKLEEVEKVLVGRK